MRNDGGRMHGKLTPPPRRTNGHIRFTSNVLRSLGIANDVACFVCAYVLAMIAYDLTIGYYYDARLHRTGAIILCINYFLIRVSRDGYAAVKGQGEDVGGSSLADFLLASGLTTLVILQLEMMREFSRGFALNFIVFSMIMSLFEPDCIPQADLEVNGQRRRRPASLPSMTDSAKGADKVAKLLELERLPHLRIIGYADDRRQTKPEERELAYLGGFEALLQMARGGQLDQVILALPQIRQDRLEYIADTLSAASIDLCVLPRETLELKTGYRVNFLGSLPVFAIWQQPIRDVDGIVKEMLDRGLAVVALILLSPILLFTCLAIRLESKGPILFRQKRFGFNNNEISVLKFRSMYVDRQDSSGAERTQKNDPRVTRVGRFIRRTSIDELPQLFNVLKGDMSLVGPRPHATMMRVGDKYYFDAVKGYTARHRVKPGITGLAQVRGLRGEIATTERARKRVEYDIYYIENWSPLLDIRIMIETVLKLIWDKNAY